MDTILYPLEWFVAALMVGWHKLFTLVGLPAHSGWTWALSIAGLVLVLRVLLIPLFVKQIHAQRRLQLLQPEMQKIQKKYKGKKDPESKAKQQEETMALYRETGTNPMGSCMPLILQAPFFYSLYRVLHNLSDIGDGKKRAIGFLTEKLAHQAETSTLFGAKLSSTFMHTHHWGAAKWVTVALIVLMSVTSFTTQHQLMRRNMPPAALESPMARQQQMIMYAMPLFFAFTGINFPIGVLIYWLSTNLWTMGQQWYVIRKMPTPGSEAERKLRERREAAGKEHKTMTMDDLRAESADKPKSRFVQAMERAQAQQQTGKAGATAAGSTKAAGSTTSTNSSASTTATSSSTPKAGSFKRRKGGASAAASDDVVTSTASEKTSSETIVSPIKETGRAPKATQTGPRNQPKKNVSRAKRKKN